MVWLAPSHYLNQCWNTVNLNLRNNLEWNLMWNSYIFIQGVVLESVICKMAAIFFSSECVKHVKVQIAFDLLPFKVLEVSREWIFHRFFWMVISPTRVAITVIHTMKCKLNWWMYAYVWEFTAKYFQRFVAKDSIRFKTDMPLKFSNLMLTVLLRVGFTTEFVPVRLALAVTKTIKMLPWTDGLLMLNGNSIQLWMEGNVLLIWHISSWSSWKTNVWSSQ